MKELRINMDQYKVKFKYVLNINNVMWISSTTRPNVFIRILQRVFLGFRWEIYKERLFNND